MKKSNALVAYFVNSYQELRKVTWPTKEETVRLTIVTLIFSLSVAIMLWILDYVFNLGVRSLIDLF